MCLTQERTALPLAGPPVHMPELTAETLQLQCQPTAVCSCVQLCLPAPHYWILTQQQPLFQRAPHSFSLQQRGKHGLLLAGSFGEDFTPPRNSVGWVFFHLSASVPHPAAPFPLGMSQPSSFQGKMEV